MPTSITSLKNCTRDSKIFWMDILLFIFTTWWARFFVFKNVFILVLGFTCKFIAPVSSYPSLVCNCKIEVLSLITLQGHIVFLRPRNKINRATILSVTSKRLWLGQLSNVHHDAQKNKSPGLFRTLWFGGWDRKFLSVA